MGHRQSTDRLHSVESAAAFLGGVSPSTIRAWLSQGRLTRIKIGRLTRVRESELLTLIHTQEIAPAEMAGHGKGRQITAAPTPPEERQSLCPKEL